MFCRRCVPETARPQDWSTALRAPPPITRWPRQAAGAKGFARQRTLCDVPADPGASRQTSILRRPKRRARRCRGSCACWRSPRESMVQRLHGRRARHMGGKEERFELGEPLGDEPIDSGASRRRPPVFPIGTHARVRVIDPAASVLGFSGLERSRVGVAQNGRAELTPASPRHRRPSGRSGAFQKLR